MRQFVVKNLRKSIENLNKRIDELEAGDLDILKESLSALEFLLEEVGDPTPAIDKYNEIISFLDLIENTSKLKSLLDDIRNSIPEAPVQSDWAEDNVNDQAYIKNKPNLSDVATSGSYNDLSDKPDLANVATSGSYEDLLNKPHIPEDPVQSDWAENDTTDQAYIKNKPNLATVATTGDYTDLSNKPDLNDFVIKPTSLSNTNNHPYVDLGLPSGTLWSTMNIGADSETGYGNYYQYGKGSAQYLETVDQSDYSQYGILPLSVDTAAQVWGGSWYTPTISLYVELIDNTTYIFTTINGVPGGKFTAPNGNYVFFPASGRYEDNLLLGLGLHAGYSTSTGIDTTSVAIMFIDSEIPSYATATLSHTDRRIGMPVRAVLNSTSKVATTGNYSDLINKPTIPAALIQSDWAQDDNTLVDYIKNKPTIPTKLSDLQNDAGFAPISGTVNTNGHDYVEIAGVKWATKNVGALTETDCGLYFLWGDSLGYTADQCGTGEGQRGFGWQTYKFAYSNSNDSKGNPIINYTKYDAGGLTILDPEDDAATVNMGGDWRMPTNSEVNALLNACDIINADGTVIDKETITTIQWETTLNGIKGLYLADKRDHTKRIFFPTAGYLEDFSPITPGKSSYYDAYHQLHCWLKERSHNGGDGNDFADSFGANVTGLHIPSYSRKNMAFPVRGVLDETNTLHKVATTGDYNDLNNKPTIPAEQIQSDWNQSDTTAKDYIKNKPNIPTNQGIVNANGHEYIEIGGVKWAITNVGASNVTDYGLYFQWGDIQGYSASQVGTNKIFNWESYKYTTNGEWTGINKYNNTDGKTTLDIADDAVRANWGGSWRMPTTAEFEALGLAVNITWVTDYQGSGVNGILCTDKIDTSKILFFPAGGYGDTNSVTDVGVSGGYWSSLRYGNSVDMASQLDVHASPNWNEYDNRCVGLFVRGVLAEVDALNNATQSQSGLMSSADKTKLDGIEAGAQAHQAPTTAEVKTALHTTTNTEKFLREDGNWVAIDTKTEERIVDNNYVNTHDYIEIDGIKWATTNVGASSVTDIGQRFMWGDPTIRQYKPYNIEDHKLYNPAHTTQYNLYIKYNDYDHKGDLDLIDDAAYINWGGKWRTPGVTEYNSLRNNTNQTWTDDYNGTGAAGVICTDKTDSSKVLFLPATVVNDIEGSTYYGLVTHQWYWINSNEGWNFQEGGAFIIGRDELLVERNGSDGHCPRTYMLPIRAIWDDSVTPTKLVKDAVQDLSTVATTGSYNDLVNKPEIIRVVEITGNLSNQTTSITGILNDGKKETIIYTNNTENTYYVTVSNSYKTLRNTLLSLVACPGGYCEVSYINKGGIIFAKGLVMGVRQSDSNSKYILATYDVTNTNAATPLIHPKALSAYADMEIDGALLSSPVSSYTFDTVGEHTVKFILPDLEQFDEQNGIKFGWINIDNKLKSIVLPEGITTIPDLAFYACQSLESVTLPSTIRTIGNEAFGSYDRGSSGFSTLIGCDKLSSINIPNGVTSIGYRCFVGCASLTNITIPDSVTSLEYSSFSQCTGLTTVSLGTGLTTLQQEMFRGCTSLTDVTISNTITSILKGAFCGCSSLQTIVIPDSVTELGGIYAYLHDYEGVFAHCTSLTNVTLSNNLGTLRGNMFCNCTSLLTLNIPDKLQSIDATALIGCSNLTAFNVSNNNTELSSIDGVIYNKDATMLVKYPTAKQGVFTIPSTVTSLGGYNQDPFIYCDGITTIEIGLNVSSIYPENFSRCSSLTAINVDANNQTYSSISGVLYNKNASKLIRCPEGKQSVTIPNTVTELGDDSFIWCANITTIDIPNSVTTIGYSAFDYCTNLSTITIPSSVTSVEDCYNFDGCTSLPVIDDIRYADTYAIRCTSSGKSTYTIKSGTRFIGNCAFEGQGNLQNITIPSTVIAMGDYVFDSCSKLETITFEGMTAPDVHRDTFREVKSSGGTIRVPANSTGYDVIMQKNGLSNWTKVEY